MKTHTESEENYIKALYHLGGEKAVNNGALAQRIGAKGPSVTQAVKRLANKNLVEARLLRVKKTFWTKHIGTNNGA